MISTLYGYTDNKTIDVVGSGTDGRAGIVKMLEETGNENVYYGAFRCIAVDDRGSTKSLRPKFTYICWIGASAKATLKPRAIQDKNVVRELVKPHIDIQTSDVSDLTEEVISAKFLASGGAHPPTGFEF